jgi:Helix-turn-helix domain
MGYYRSKLRAVGIRKGDPGLEPARNLANIGLVVHPPSYLRLFVIWRVEAGSRSVREHTDDYPDARLGRGGNVGAGAHGALAHAGGRAGASCADRQHTADGLSTPGIAARMGLCSATVRFWLKRFNERGLGGLEEDICSGRPSTYTAEERSAVIAAALSRPAEWACRSRRGRWTAWWPTWVRRASP